MRSLYTFEQRNYIILALTVIVGACLLMALQGLFSAVLGAIVLYTIFKSWYLYLAEKRKIRRWLSALCVMFTSFLIIVLPVTLLIFMVVTRAGEFVSEPGAFQNIHSIINRFTADILNRPELLRDIVATAQASIFGIFRDVLSGGLDVFLQITIMYFILYFMFVDHSRLEKALLKYSPFRPQTSLLFAQELKYITFSNVIGQGVIAIIQGALLGVGFLIFGIEGAFFWAVVTMFLSFLPVIGAPIIFVPAALFAISQGNTGSGIGLLIYGSVLIINIDNVLRLYIARKIGDIHPLITIVGVVIGIPIFGILGLIYGPLLLSFFFLLIKVYESNQKEILRNEENELKPGIKN